MQRNSKKRVFVTTRCKNRRRTFLQNARFLPRVKWLRIISFFLKFRTRLVYLTVAIWKTKSNIFNTFFLLRTYIIQKRIFLCRNIEALVENSVFGIWVLFGVRVKMVIAPKWAISSKQPLAQALWFKWRNKECQQLWSVAPSLEDLGRRSWNPFRESMFPSKS